MKIEESTVRKLRITDVPRIDPITVILEDFEHGKGKIIIECYGKSWSSFWGAMGGTIADFFTSCDDCYLIGNLDAGLRSTVFDPDGLRDKLKGEVLKQRRQRVLKDHEAKDLYEEVERVSDVPTDNVDLICRVWGVSYEWWHDMPEKDNPDYLYLQRIVKVVQEALKQNINSPVVAA